MKFNIFKEKSEFFKENYVIVTYELQSTDNIEKAAWDLAIGQSVGNPNVRNEWETDELFENHSAIIFAEKGQYAEDKFGTIDIGFPIINTNWKEDGIAHLLCQVMGGQVDIDHIKKCRAIEIQIPQSVRDQFKKPKFGITGFRDFVGQHNKPLFGGIVKPKTGVSPQVLLEMVKQMVDGGVDFIKEDEILANPAFCSLEDRVPLISNYLAKVGRNVVYCFCINSDPAYIEKRAKFVHQEGGVGVHINVWSGLGSYRTLRELDLPLFIHYQKSGDKVITHKGNPYSISWKVLCELAALCGVDTIHAGMWGGYLSDEEDELRQTLEVLRNGNVLPALSCGMHPGIVNTTADKFGIDFLANCGGSIHGHPGGTLAGARAMRQAVDKTPGPEFRVAIDKWGYETDGKAMPEWVLDF